VAGHRAGEGLLVGEEDEIAELLSLSLTLEREGVRENEKKPSFPPFINTKTGPVHLK